jgi:hypothetical protein
MVVPATEPATGSAALFDYFRHSPTLSHMSWEKYVRDARTAA